MTHNDGLILRTVPARSGEPPHPVLVLLHGRGADELDLLGLAPMLDERLFVVSPRAPFAWEIGYCWYDMESPDRHRETSKHGLALLRELVEGLASTCPIDPDRVYLLGFSQGSYMANALTLTAPELVAGAILLSGYQPPLGSLSAQTDGIRGKPIFVGHGTHDPLLGIQQGRGVRDTLTNLGAEVTYREYEMAHQILVPELEDIGAWLRARLD